jgi:hypothetical protein
MKATRALTALAAVLLAGITGAAAKTPGVSNTTGPAKSPNVKNAPFSADVISEYDRALDNGGHIRRESRGRIYRDSQGRTRTESQASPPQSSSESAEQNIIITDPLQQVVIYLNPRNKTATVLHFGEQSPTPVTTAKRSKQKSKIKIGGQPGIGDGPTDTLGVPPVPSGQASAASNHSIPTPDSGGSRTDETILSSNTAGATIVPLGTRIVAGMTATGTRTTRTMTPGTMGNDRPIVFISDTWTSAELKVAVLTATDDGQEGHSTMKLENIVRSEPSAALFQIPPGYTVKQNNVATAGTSH